MVVNEARGDPRERSMLKAKEESHFPIDEVWVACDKYYRKSGGM